MTNIDEVNFLDRGEFAGIAQNKIGYKQTNNKANKSAGIIWCGGLKSDMDGSKASFVHEWAMSNGSNFIRFDYFGHGTSTGKFSDGNISRWTEDTIAIIDEQTTGEQILVGSSMGGWCALLAGLARPERIKALVLIAPAPDFTEKLMWASFDDEIRRQIMKEGIYLQPSEYDEPYEISKTLIMDGRNNLLLDAPINLDIPVRILHGQQDTSVPWQQSLQLADKLKTHDVVTTFIKDGDHSLSRPQDLDRIVQAIIEVL